MNYKINPSMNYASHQTGSIYWVYFMLRILAMLEKKKLIETFKIKGNKYIQLK